MILVWQGRGKYEIKEMVGKISVFRKPEMENKRFRKQTLASFDRVYVEMVLVFRYL